MQERPTMPDEREKLVAITQEEHEAVQKQGANARAMGRSQFANPFYKSEAMPRLTREPIEVWNAKQEAWHLGWSIENAMRSAILPTSAVARSA